MLENKQAGNYEAHYSRYIASWRNAGGTHFGNAFENWLSSEGLTESEIQEITNMAIMGKLELEKSARSFVADEKNFIKSLEDDIEVIKKKGTVKRTITHLKYRIKKHFK